MIQYLTELGVKFLADLSVAPSDGRSVPGEVKDGASGTSGSAPTQKDAETQVLPSGRRVER